MSCRVFEAPQVVRAWIANPTAWLKPGIAAGHDIADKGLDAGERVVLSLADAMRATLILMDDRAGVAEARPRGFSVIGTLGILDFGRTPRIDPFIGRVQ